LGLNTYLNIVPHFTLCSPLCVRGMETGRRSNFTFIIIIIIIITIITGKGSCERGDEPPGSIKCWEVLE
jgi:hypothetical protein